MNQILRFIAQHPDVSVRFVRDGKVYLTSPAVQFYGNEACPCSDLSEPISTMTEAHNYLGY